MEALKKKICSLYSSVVSVSRSIRSTIFPLATTHTQDAEVDRTEVHDPCSKNEILVYEPNGIQGFCGYGASSRIGRVRQGVILKSPLESWWDEVSNERREQTTRLKNSFHVETGILEELGEHPRIVRYLGRSEDPKAQGILLGEASHGDLQTYLDSSDNPIDYKLRKEWCFQAGEAISYIHERGVIHSDLRPENFLVDSDIDGDLNLRLCDFGGSTFGELDGGSLPDPGFSDPEEPWESTPSTDIFSLGSIFYTIMVRHWPHRPPGPHKLHTQEENLKYYDEVNRLFSSRVWPNVSDIEFGDIILGCWTKRFATAESVLQALRQSSPRRE